MHIKPDAEDEDYSSFLEPYSITGLIKKYSDFVRWPIIMTDESGEDRTINSQIPVWQRPKSEVTDGDCFAFYKESLHGHDDPLSVLRIDAEGLCSYKAMVFIPKTAPFDFYSRGFEPGLALYSSGVMIMEKCAELLPECFRFARGVVDSPDLSLNISRELPQHSRQLRIIAQNLEKKIRTELLRLISDERGKYEEFFTAFGPALKYGALSGYGEKAASLSDLLLFYSSKQEKLITLGEYAKSMPKGQKLIYFATGESEARAAGLPQAERVLDAGYDLLCLTFEADEFVMQAIGEYDQKHFRNVSAGDLELSEAEAGKESGETYKAVLDFVKSALDGKVSDVTLSPRLKSHPVCLTAKGDITLDMEKYFAAAPNGGRVKAERILELNAAHPAFAALSGAVSENPERAVSLAKILYNQAILIAGLSPEDPSEYADLVCSLF
jgi:molecular chaperone HtpG